MEYTREVLMTSCTQTAQQEKFLLSGVSDAGEASGTAEILRKFTNMSHTPPIKVKELSKKGILDEDRFFRLLSEENNYVDHDTAKDFYLGLVRTITKELRTNGVIRLPHLGDIALVKQKDSIGWSGKVHAILTGKYMLKFYPNQIWRKYFSKLGERSGLEGSLDPREKVLGQTLE